MQTIFNYQSNCVFVFKTRMNATHDDKDGQASEKCLFLYPNL